MSGEIRYEIAKMMFDYRIIETDGTLVFNNWCYETKEAATAALDKFLTCLEPIPLTSLQKGCGAVVESVSGRWEDRLLDLGFLGGTPIRQLKRAPLGDSSSYELRGAEVCLRDSEASDVLVRPEPEGWFRHFESGRRRPGGDPEKEHMQP